tara:strand:+ start:612 stop:2123 length:1512 start_codon:yes stop_codon:yes gene_type:complete
MALSLGDVFLNFTAGAVERNNQIRDENVALALEDFKANKDLYQKIALDRYTRDSNTYDKELEKMDSLKSVYSFIENNNLDRNSAASLILTNSMPGFKNLDEKEQRRLISQTANSFETNYKTVEGDGTPDGVQTKQVEDGFKIKPEQIKLTAPNMKDYLQDPSFWTNLQDEIKTGTSGPLTEQVLKLLGKEDSSEGAKEVLNNLEQKDGTVIKSEASVPAVVSKNQGLVDTKGLKVLDEDDPNYVDVQSLPSDLTSIRNSYTGLRNDSFNQKILSEFAQMSNKDLSFYGEMKDGKFAVKSNGIYIVNQMENILKNIENRAWQSMLVTNDRRYYNEEDILKAFSFEVRNRSIPLDNMAIFRVGEDIQGFFVLNSDIMPMGGFLSQSDKVGLSNYMNERIGKLNGSISDNQGALEKLAKDYFIQEGIITRNSEGQETWNGSKQTKSELSDITVRSDGKIEVNSMITTNIEGITIPPKIYSIEDFKKVKQDNPTIIFPDAIEKLLKE